MDRLYSVFVLLFSLFLILGNNEEFIVYSNFISLVFVGITIIKLKGKIYTDSFIRALLFFVIFATISLIWSISKENSLKVLRPLYTILIILIILRSVFANIMNRKMFLYGIFIALFINYLDFLSIIKLPIETYENYRYMGSLGKSNILAITSVFYLMMLFLFFINGHMKKKIDLGMIFLSLFICGQLCLATGSRKGLLGYGIILIIFFVAMQKRNKRKSGNVLKIILVIISGYYLVNSFLNSESFEMSYNRLLGLGFNSDVDVDNSTLERKRLFLKAIDLFAESPIVGNGINSFRSTSWAYSHSNLGEILSGVGILGLLLFYRMHVTLLKQLKNKDNIIKIGVLFSVVILLAFEFSMVTYYDKFFYLCMYFLYYEIGTKKSVEF